MRGDRHSSLVGEVTTTRMQVGAVKYEISKLCQKVWEREMENPNVLKKQKKSLFTSVLNQNCRHNCTNQGLNCKQLLILVLVLP